MYQQYNVWTAEDKNSNYTQFAVYISDTPVTLKQSQGHQTYNDNIDPKQGFSHGKFERSCFDCVREKANGNCFKRGNTSVISLEHVQKQKIKNCGTFMIYLT